MRFGYKGFNGKYGQGTHSTKMVADKSAENTPKAPKIVCLSPNVWGFDKKRLHWVSVDHVVIHQNYHINQDICRNNDKK